MPRGSTLIAAATALIAWAGASAALARSEPPPNALPFEDTGTLEAAQANVLQFRDSKNDGWLLEVVDATKISVLGEAEVDCLRTGTYVELMAALDKKGALTKEISEIEIVPAPAKGGLGFFAEAETDPAAKPLRNPGAGSYRIKGKVVSFKEGELLIMAGSRKVYGQTGDDLKVKVNLNDPSISQPGDEVKIKAWYYQQFRPNAVVNRPGKGQAEEVVITLAKPLAYGGKKARPSPAKPAKASKAESRASKG